MGQASSKATSTKQQPQQPQEETASTPASSPFSTSSISDKLALGAGCYWGTEKYVRKDFQKLYPNSIKSCQVGFMAPAEARWENPTYKQVCTGASGHIEVLYVELNEPEKHFEPLMQFFFQFHDPTTQNRQGNDRGFQYASWIFCEDAAQTAIAEQVKSRLQNALNDGKLKNCYRSKQVTTQVTQLKKFTPAEAEHQEYLLKNPQGYCNHRMRFKSWPK